jgi:hypothetical protein
VDPTRSARNSHDLSANRDKTQIEGQHRELNVAWRVLWIRSAGHEEPRVEIRGGEERAVEQSHAEERASARLEPERERAAEK